ncbi:response regulator [Chitinophaga japonensis]|uniref:Response regulator receiver domain-containing protein n=1 Tax=Chitinophaga japonensis TaxID=104662 RepID=A0A562TCD8_CHIJA|nr:response regulator [Chitinophaga japonensis]TWI91043.1 response regulator receiver domain-containing protein [Chitinophaga japonensis]
MIINGNGQQTRKCILVADDDADDRELIKVAFEENKADLDMCFVENGEDLLQYLYRRGKYRDEVKYPFPSLILLDLNMPKKDGREALREIKEDNRLKSVPIVILTTSTAAKDISKCYELGVNSYMIKPTNFADLVQFAGMLHTYWFNTVQLPV